MYEKELLRAYGSGLYECVPMYYQRFLQLCVIPSQNAVVVIAFVDVASADTAVAVAFVFVVLDVVALHVGHKAWKLQQHPYDCG